MSKESYADYNKMGFDKIYSDNSEIKFDIWLGFGIEDEYCLLTDDELDKFICRSIPKDLPKRSNKTCSNKEPQFAFDNISHIPNSSFREELVDEVYLFIYCEDIETARKQFMLIQPNYLFRESPYISYGYYHPSWQRLNGYRYVRMSKLVCWDEELSQYVPNQLEIDTVVLDVFPDLQITRFLNKAKDIVSNYVLHQNYDQTIISFRPFFSDSISIYPQIDNSSNDVNINVIKDEFSSVYVEVQLKNYIKFRGNRASLDSHKFLLLALNNYNPS